MSNPFGETATADVEDNDALSELENTEVQADLDVDTPDASDEIEEVPGSPEVAEKPAKAAKAPARPPVPEGYVTPVAFAKILTEHLRNKGKLAGDKEIAPQMVYSYLNNSNKEGSKYPWQSYSVGGRDNLLKVDESLAWWDAKDERVASRKTAKANKEAAKAEKAAAKATDTAPEAAATGPVEEAE
jgi:hypothetical protein